MRRLTALRVEMKNCSILSVTQHKKNANKKLSNNFRLIAGKSTKNAAFPFWKGNTAGKQETISENQRRGSISIQ